MFSAMFVLGTLYFLGFVMPFTFVSRESIVNRSNCDDQKMALNEHIAEDL